MVIKNIIKSETEPATNCLWLKDNSLYHHNNGEWVEVDLNTVQGVEKLNRDVSDLTTQLQLMRDDYIGVWDELNNVKEILAAVQSGELANLLSQLGYDEQDIDSFVEANLHLELGITVEDVRQSVDKWNDLGYFYYKNRFFDNGSRILDTRVAPKWTKEMDEKGLSISYTGDMGTINEIIRFDEFANKLFKNADTYYPFIYHSGITFDIFASFIDKADIYLYEYHNPEEGIDEGPNPARIDVVGINELTITHSNSRIPIIELNRRSSGSFRRLGKSNIKSNSSSGTINLDKALAGQIRIEHGNLDISNANYVKQLFSLYYGVGDPSEVQLGNTEFLEKINNYAPLVGYWDLCTVANNNYKFKPSEENSRVAEYAFYLRKIKNSNIYMNEKDGRVLEGCCMENTNVYLDYSNLGDIPGLFSYMGVPITFMPGFEGNLPAHIYINNSGNLVLEGSPKFKDILKSADVELPVHMAHPLVLHLPNIASISINYSGSWENDKEWFIADLSSGRKEHPIPINKMVSSSKFSFYGFRDPFMEYFNTWGNGDGTIIELTTDQNNQLNNTDKATITGKGYTISINDN